MTFTFKNIIAITILLVVIAAISLLMQTPFEVRGSIDTDSGGYNATTTPLGSGAFVTLKDAPGLLGSVVVTGSNSGNIQIYDATTTDVNKRTRNIATSTLLIATLPANTSTSTYTYDVTLKYGLVVVTSGNAATSTITWK